MKKILTPTNTLIEETAAQLAAEWYCIGRSQGLTSVCKNEREYAKKNLERFIPKAVEYLLEMLKPDSNATEEMKSQIYEAMCQRHNDEELNQVLPNFDVKRAIELAEQMEKKKVIDIKGLN